MGNSEWTVAADVAGVRLDKYLADAARLGSRGRAATALARGKVFVGDEEAGPDDAGRRLAPGDVVRIWMDRPGSARRRTGRSGPAGELRIVYEDDALIVVDKPAGLLAVPLPEPDKATSVHEQLVAHLRSRGKRKPLVVHRIDRDTSGMVVFATRTDAQLKLRDQFRRHEPVRVYLAVVYGHPSPQAGMWRDHMVWDRSALIQRATHPRDPRGQEARSEYRVVQLFRDASLVEVRLVTGRRNQIRLQARLHGHSLVGERRYVSGPDALRPIAFPRQALHAHQLAFRHPVTNERLRFESPLPPDMVELLARLRQS